MRFAGLATTGGLSATEPVGVVRWAPRAEGTVDYLLTHLEANSTLPDEWAADRPGLIERYSLLPGADWWAGDLRGEAGCYRFRAYHHGIFHAEVRLRVPGAHQVAPALAALAIGFRSNLAMGVIKDRLEDFSGVPRGFECRGSFRGVTLIDDDASGREGVALALSLARQVFGSRIIRAVYLAEAPPRLLGLPEPIDFEEANHLFLVERPESEPESTRHLVARLRSSGAAVVCCPNLEAATWELDRYLEPGNVMITLGAGEVGTIADAFLRRLRRDHHG